MKGTHLLRLLGHCLRPQGPPPETVERLRAHDVPWPQVVRAASLHLVSPGLAWSLEKAGLCPHLEPDLRAYFRAVLTLNRERNARLRDELLEVSGWLAAEGGEPVVLKGGACLVDGPFPDLGLRLLADLDVLVADDRLGACVQALEGRGYRVLSPGRRRSGQAHHHPRLAAPGRLGGVELHRLVLPRPHSALLRADELAAAARPALSGEAWPKVPSPAHRAAHGLLHAALAHQGHAAGFYRLRELQESVFLRAAHGDALDWDELSRRLDVLGKPAVLQRFFGLTHAWLGVPPPAGFAARTRGDWLGALTVRLYDYPRLLLLRLFWVYGVLPRAGTARKTPWVALSKLGDVRGWWQRVVHQAAQLRV